MKARSRLLSGLLGMAIVTGGAMVGATANAKLPTVRVEYRGKAFNLPVITRDSPAVRRQGGVALARKVGETDSAYDARVRKWLQAGYQKADHGYEGATYRYFSDYEGPIWCGRIASNDAISQATHPGTKEQLQISRIYAKSRVYWRYSMRAQAEDTQTNSARAGAHAQWDRGWICGRSLGEGYGNHEFQASGFETYKAESYDSNPL